MPNMKPPRFSLSVTSIAARLLLLGLRRRAIALRSRPVNLRDRCRANSRLLGQLLIAEPVKLCQRELVITERRRVRVILALFAIGKPNAAARNADALRHGATGFGL